MQAALENNTGMKHETFLTLPYELERDPPPFECNGIKSPESLARYMLKTYTKKGDRVFDPFAGLGTTLFTAEEMGRIPFGVEAERQRYEWTAGQMRYWQNLIHADSGGLDRLKLPKMDFCLTAPPYMARNHTWNPLFSGDPKKAGYQTYLRRMRFIFKQIAAQMKRGAFVVVQADNLHTAVYTPLVRDLSLAIEPSLRFEAETIVTWTTTPEPDALYTHGLIFKKT